MNSTAQILVVDDEKEICDVVRQYLTDEGYQVCVAHDGNEMRRVMAQGRIGLVILDLMLRGEDGLTLVRMLREQSTVGIIILTGRGDTVDRIIGLEMGADDYLPKPFHMRELLARVKSVLRRVSDRADAKQTGAAGQSNARFAGWHLDLMTRALTSPNGAEVRLTTGEFELLAAFVKHAKQVMSRDRLLDLTRSREGGPFDRAIDVQVGRLRRKLEPNPNNPIIIKTVRGAGYVFTPPVEVL